MAAVSDSERNGSALALMMRGKIDEVRQDVVAALLPICMAQAAADPDNGARLSELKETRSDQRAEVLMKTGWATMPGSSEPDPNLAMLCAETLSAEL